MKNIKLYIASSIDGYIARIDGNLDWLMQYPITPENNYGYNDFYDSIDTIIMGGKTYRDIMNMDVVWPYKDKITYVITRGAMSAKENIYFIMDNIIETVSNIQEREGKDVWLMGGSEIIATLLDHNAIEEIIITIIPVILGNGIPLFRKIQKGSEWSLVAHKSFNNGILQATYKRKCAFY